MKSLKSLKITEYELMWDQSSLRRVSLQLRRGLGCERWAIVQNTGNCLGKTPNEHGYFTFDYEPLPSSRDDDYFREYRFVTPEEAYQFWQENRCWILATPAERMAFVKKMRGIAAPNKSLQPTR